MDKIYDTFGQQEITGGAEQHVRRDTVLDKIKRAMWNAVAADEIHKDIFTMADARSFFDQMLSKRPVSEQMEDTCTIAIERDSDRYTITQVLMDKNGNPVRMTAKSYYGRVLTAKHIDELVVKYMDGQTVRIMPNPNR